jgi:hypothetical protein
MNNRMIELLDEIRYNISNMRKEDVFIVVLFGILEISFLVFILLSMST